MQAIKLNSRVITILGIISSVIGLILMADWQSIPYDPCPEFSLYQHPELASGVSNTSLPPCPLELPDCPWLNVSLQHNTIAVMTFEEEVAVAAMSLQHVKSLSPRHPIVNKIAYKFAMNVCESLSSSQYHCHWIPNSVITHRLCHATNMLKCGSHSQLCSVHDRYSHLSNHYSYSNNWYCDGNFRCCQSTVSGGL